MGKDPGSHDSTSDPLLVDPPSDLSIPYNSPAIDAGYNLSGFFSYDFLGYSRDDHFDIGAYEYNSYTNPENRVNPPKNLRIMSQP